MTLFLVPYTIVSPGDILRVYTSVPSGRTNVGPIKEREKREDSSWFELIMVYFQTSSIMDSST